LHLPPLQKLRIRSEKKGVTMKLVRDVMSRDIRHVPPDTKLTDAARTMKEFDLGMLPIVREERLTGVVTDRDIVVRGLGEGREPMKATVCSVMTREPVCCYEDQPLDEAARLMSDRQIRRLVVLDHDEKIRGVCSLGDVATAASDETAGKTLEKVSEPSTD
jgi:CBS domain-containing protein